MKNSIKSLVFAILTATTLDVNAQALDAAPQALPSGSGDRSVSQLIRSYPQHFWSTMKLRDYESPLAPFIQFEGVVTGDPHFGNFSVIPLIDKKGQESLQFADIDFDDAGVGPFIVDFARLVTSSKAIEQDLKADEKFANVRDMVAAYIEGLNGRKIQTPAIIQTELDKGIKSYREKLNKLVENRLDKKDKNKLALEEGEIVPLSHKMDVLKDQIPDQFPDMKVLDVVRVLKDRGGSAGSIRLLVLLKDKSGTRRLFELKQWQETGMTSYQPQKTLQDWVQDLYPAFWPGMSDEGYKIVKLDSLYFWKREKKKTLLDVPYKIDKNSDLRYLQNLAPFVANTLGQIHGRQASAAGLKVALSNPESQEVLRQAVKVVYRKYLDLARATIP
jgi:hypothetical protein